MMVAGLTAGALAVVGFFAYQAAAAQDRPSPSKKPPAASPTDNAPVKPSAPAPEKTALPAESGTGQRVVYGLSAERVWLVDAGDNVTRTYRVKPSTVHPSPGEYHVTSRTEQITGSDGVPIEHVVLFTSVDGTVIGFSAAVDGSLADPDPAQKTGGIRQARADGAALWDFTSSGSTVVVVP